MSEEAKKVETKLNLIQKLAQIQLELKAPKNQRNKFGGYNYRSAEDILEAVKPLAIKYGAVVHITDEVVNVGDRIYVKAHVSLYDMDNIGNSISSYALAREEETKKGMDGSQITGAASSYARKYALNGMFAIDDTKDSDATNDGTGGSPSTPPMKKSAADLLGASKPAPKPAPKKSVNPKYKEAWEAYKSCPPNEGVDTKVLGEQFKNLCAETIGDKNPQEYTDEDWDAVIEAVNHFADIPF